MTDAEVSAQFEVVFTGRELLCIRPPEQPYRDRPEPPSVHLEGTAWCRHCWAEVPRDRFTAAGVIRGYCRSCVARWNAKYRRRRPAA